MNLLYNLDYSEPLNESELLGRISLVGDDKNEIVERDTFVDSWLLALSEGIRCLTEKKNCKIDIPEEPYPLIFNAIEKTVAYGNQVIVIDDFKEMNSNLKIVVSRFLQEVASKKEDGTLSLLRKFL